MAFIATDVAPLKPRLIIIDPFADYQASLGDRDAIGAMRWLGILAKRSGAAVLATQSVADSTDDLAREFYATPRSVLTLTPLGQNGRRLAITKSNLEHLPRRSPAGLLLRR